MLLECHERIRTFSRMAEEVGRRPELPAAEVAEACARCERYFVEALPLHVADEEESIVPRLTGKRPEVDGALATMHRQHGEHEADIAALVAALRAVKASPEEAGLREQLRVVAERLSRAFEEHLAAEEQVLFPAIRAVLAPEVQAEIVAEQRARRER